MVRRYAEAPPEIIPHATELFFADSEQHTRLAASLEQFLHTSSFCTFIDFGVREPQRATPVHRLVCVTRLKSNLTQARY